MHASRSYPRSIVVAVLLLSGCASASSPTPSPTLDGPPESSAPTATPSVAPTDPVASRSGAIAAGYQHTCVVTPAGGVRCWGGNGSGQLGSALPLGTGSADPVEVGGLGDDVRAIAAGAFHTCGLTAGGGVKCWGYNSYGQLGNGSNADSNSPVEVTGLGSGVVAISAGWSHTCALTAGGAAKCWGNTVGGLGNGTTTASYVPVDVSGLSSGVVAIAAGSGHTCAVTTAGGVTCWGDGQAADRDAFHTSVPDAVPGLDEGVTAIAAGLDHTCAARARGDVVCWGPYLGESPTGPALVAVDLGSIGPVTMIALGESHACALDDTGRVGCWGGNTFGQLGHFAAPSAAVASAIDGLDGAAIAIAAGGGHSCALDVDGEVRCWGWNHSGQLGPTVECQSQSWPVRIPVHGGPDPQATAAPPIPAGEIEHATGPTDVLLRVDAEPDQAAGELTGEIFQAGPEFTMYGDGTILIRDTSSAATVDGAFLRGAPFVTARIAEASLQTLLRRAFEAGLAASCERYDNVTDTDAFGGVTILLRAGDVDRRIEVGGPSPFGDLIDALLPYDPVPLPTETWRPSRSWGTLFDVGGYVDAGTLPDPRTTGSLPWPWPEIQPDDFEPEPAKAWGSYPLRAMSADELGALGAVQPGDVVERVYLQGPDGETIYALALWPMAPDELD